MSQPAWDLTPEEELQALEDYVDESAADDVNDYIEEVYRDELGEPIVQAKVHEDLQRFMRENDFGVVEMHRECGKTTQAIGLISHIIGNNPNDRIKIVSNSDGEATKRGKATGELLLTDRYQEIFPHISPGREWTEKRLTVQRDVITPESTLECYGIGSRATGGRCDWLFLDDPDDEEVVMSAAKRKRNVDRVENVWINQLTPRGKAFILCTPWHESDTAHKLKEKGWPVFRRPVVDMVPVWKERWNRAALAKRKAQIGSLAFARGFELIPITSETAPIKGWWFGLWTKLPKLTAIGIAVDPNNSLSEDADWTAIGLLGVDWNYRVYLLELLREHYEFPGLMDAIKKFAAHAEKRYKMRPYIGVEDTAYQKAIPLQLKRETRWPIFGIKADKSKFIRASRFAVHAENGRVFLKGGPNNTVHPEQQVAYDECVMYPAGANDDCVDMLGYGTEMMVSLARKGQAIARGGR